MSQKSKSDNLSENPVPNEDDVLSEHQKMTGKETRESSDISNQNDQLGNAAKAGEIDKAKNAIDQNIESTQNAYSNPGSVSDPNTMVQWVLRESFIESQEDLKNYAGKVKPGKETKASSGSTQQGLIAQLLAHVNHFGIEIGISKRFTILGVLLVAGVVVAVAVGGLGLLNPKTESPNPGLADSLQPNNNPLELVLVTPETNTGNNPLDLVLITPATKTSNNPLELALVTPSNPVCSIRFTNPIRIAELPNSGPALFEWTSVPGASAYSLNIAPPAEASLPWIYSVTGTSKKIYMENFPMGGTFLVSINALSESKEVLCVATLRFDKAAFIAADKENNDVENNNESESTPCITTGMAYFCP